MRLCALCMGAALLLLCYWTERCEGSAAAAGSNKHPIDYTTADSSVFKMSAPSHTGGSRRLQQQPAAALGVMQQQVWACPSGRYITEATRVAVATHKCYDAPEFPGKLRCGPVLASPQLILDINFNQCTRVAVRPFHYVMIIKISANLFANTECNGQAIPWLSCVLLTTKLYFMIFVPQRPCDITPAVSSRMAHSGVIKIRAGAATNRSLLPSRIPDGVFAPRYRMTPNSMRLQPQSPRRRQRMQRNPCRAQQPRPPLTSTLHLRAGLSIAAALSSRLVTLPLRPPWRLRRGCRCGSPPPAILSPPAPQRRLRPWSPPGELI